MTAWTRKTIKSYQIGAMQMFQQAENGSSTWEEAARACRMYDLIPEAEYCEMMAGNGVRRNRYIGEFTDVEISMLEEFDSYTFWKTNDGIIASHPNWNPAQRITASNVRVMQIHLLCEEGR